MEFDDKKVKIVIADGVDAITKKKYKIKNKKYDLICVDTYVADEFPEKFENTKFVLAVKDLLEKDGVAVFNRLYYGEKRALAEKFEKDAKMVQKYWDEMKWGKWKM